MIIGVTFSGYFILDLQLTQKRQSLFFLNNELYIAPIFVDSDLLCPCFFLRRHLKKRLPRN